MGIPLNTPPPVPGRPPEKKSSSGKKILIGCGIGCGSLIVMSIIAAFIALWWFFSSEDQIPVNSIFNSDTAAAFRLEDISAYPETMELISQALKELENSRNNSLEDMPEFFKKLNKFSQGNQDPAQAVKMFRPKEAAISFSINERDDLVFVIAANFKSGTRIVKLILNTVFEVDPDLKGNKISTEHGDFYIFEQKQHEYSQETGESILGFYMGTLIFSNDPEYVLNRVDGFYDGTDSEKLKSELSPNRLTGWHRPRRCFMVFWMSYY